MSIDSYREITASQLPALRLLMSIGWQYLTPSEALDIGRNPNTFPKYMKRAARMLSAAYA